ncbi:HD domain-containing protein [Natranaerovirga pectinivora]|uniref:HD domain-containing protein n=1 Tax=Natranaerovirga pectinivora TaxID=682400 RepID=A0A4R3MK65_9FIRM|nr:HD domain-containing protein [Natranaerovirga pectinivora]TCT13966.1 HD domain-containing protein [Natranaerovirga pectinivora]
MIRVNKILNHKVFNEYLERINKAEENRLFCLHNIGHLLDVARVGYIISLEKGFNLDKEMIYAASLLHDIGRWKQYLDGSDHALVSARLAVDILKECDFNDQEIDGIIESIKKHRKGKDLITNLDFVLYHGDKKSRLCLKCNSINECLKGEKEDYLKLEY